MLFFDRLERSFDGTRTGVETEPDAFGANDRDVLDADMRQHAFEIGDGMLEGPGRTFAGIEAPA